MQRQTSVQTYVAPLPRFTPDESLDSMVKALNERQAAIDTRRWQRAAAVVKADKAVALNEARNEARQAAAVAAKRYAAVSLVLSRWPNKAVPRHLVAMKREAANERDEALARLAALS